LQLEREDTFTLGRRRESNFTFDEATPSKPFRQAELANRLVSRNATTRDTPSVCMSST